MTRAEHLLTIAAEECAEVAQRCSKANRFGMAEVEPGQALNNRDRIVLEFAHLIGVLDMMGITVDGVNMASLEAAKRFKVEQFLNYSRQCGTLTEAAVATQQEL